MKNFLILFLVAISLFSCNKSDDSDSVNDQSDSIRTSLLGVWSIAQIEIEYRCDNDSLLDEGFEPDVVDNVGDVEFTVDGTYHFLDNNGEVRDIEDMNGEYQIEGDIITFFYTVNGEPRSSTDHIVFTETGDLELRDVDYCETHTDLGLYYAERYVKVSN